MTVLKLSRAKPRWCGGRGVEARTSKGCCLVAKQRTSIGQPASTARNQRFNRVAPIRGLPEKLTGLPRGLLETPLETAWPARCGSGKAQDQSGLIQLNAVRQRHLFVRPVSSGPVDSGPCSSTWLERVQNQQLSYKAQRSRVLLGTLRPSCSLSHCGTTNPESALLSLSLSRKSFRTTSRKSSVPACDRSTCPCNLPGFRAARLPRIHWLKG